MRLALDTSAVAAVVFGEPRAEEMLDVMGRYAGGLYLGAATRVELGSWSRPVKVLLQPQTSVWSLTACA